MITFKILSNCERVKSFLKSLGADTLAAPGFQEKIFTLWFAWTNERQRSPKLVMLPDL